MVNNVPKFGGLGIGAGINAANAPLLQGFGFGIGYGSGVRVGYEQVYPKIAGHSNSALDFILNLIPGYSTTSEGTSLNQLGPVASQGQIASPSSTINRDVGHNPGYRGRIITPINRSGAIYERHTGPNRKIIRLVE